MMVDNDVDYDEFEFIEIKDNCSGTIFPEIYFKDQYQQKKNDDDESFFNIMNFNCLDKIYNISYNISYKIFEIIDDFLEIENINYITDEYEECVF